MNALIVKPSTYDTCLTDAIAFIKQNRGKRRSWLPIIEVKINETDTPQQIVLLDRSKFDV